MEETPAPAHDPDELACAAVLSGLVASGTPVECAARNAVEYCAALEDDPSPTLLDGLLRLARKSKQSRRPSLEALLLCGSRSNRAWGSVVRIRDVFPEEFGDVMVDAFLAPRDWLRDRLDAIEAKPTPAQVALESASGERLVQVVDKLTQGNWAAIPRSVLVSVICEVARNGAVNALLLERAKVAFDGKSPALARVYSLIPSLKETRVVNGEEDAEFDRMLTAYSDKPLPLEQVRTAEQAFAYSRAHGLCVPKIAAAYVAVPSDIEIEPKFGDQVVAQPRWLRGKVDDAIDNALATVMSKIPSLRMMYKTKADDDLMTLVRQYPWLVRRRIEEVSACLYVLLDGLSDSEERYEPNALGSMATLLQVLAFVMEKTRTSFRAQRHVEQEVLEVIFETVQFVMAEGRAQNGVPDMFEPVVVQLVAVLAVYKDDVRVQNLSTIWMRISDAKGSSGKIRNAINGFLGQLADISI